MRSVAAAILLPVLLGGCFWRWWGGGDSARAGVPDPQAVVFAQRAAGFYDQLEGTSLVAALTFEELPLQDYFEDRAAYNAYFASLGTQIRRAQLRLRRADRIEMREFRLLRPDEAVVELGLFGRHERQLRFWEMELTRYDTWRRIDGVWILTPDQL